MKHIYLIGGLLLFATALGSCSDTQTDLIDQTVTEGKTPILFTGALSRTTTEGDCGGTTTEGTTYNNIHLSAYIGNESGISEPKELYFKNVAINEATLPSTTNATKAPLEPTETLHYPLGTGLRFFAYSGTADDSQNLTLTAGSGATNDVILSNGTDKDEDFSEGKGTYGNENTTDNILLTFRHVMTKIYVSIEVDDEDSSNENDHVNPIPENISITLKDGLAVNKGTYPITATSASTATVTDNSSYTLTKGVNYLVPNGAVLTGTTDAPVNPIQRIVIDYYDTNGTQDCSNLTISPATSNEKAEVKLLPGQAYGLVFKVKRLKVTGITFTKIDWNTVVLGNESSSYVPAKLNMNLGDYASDNITKVVLHTSENSENKQYIGKVEYENSAAVGQFVNLPATAPTSVDLYTADGLLVAGVTPTASSYKADNGSATDKEITLALSAGGMKTKDSGEYNANTNPYLVETPVQFCNISKDMTASYCQGNDLDLTVLSSSIAGTFTGTYDGNGKRILNATFTGNGLFENNSGALKNIRLASGKIAATGTHAGSICGTNSGTIVACINQAQIHGTATHATHAGGICGKNNGSIIACLNTGDIFTGSQYSGGICGENTSVTTGAITACVNVGMMNRGSENMAGICGTSSGSNILKTCYWLTGTAKRYSGNDASVHDTEVAANNYTPATTDDVADLSPQKLRDSNTNEETGDDKKTTALLNAAIGNTTWNNAYEFTYDVAKNSCVWPMPVKKSTTINN